MWKSSGAAACVAALTIAAPAGAAEALAIAKQGYFFVGGKYAPVGDKQVMTGQAYVEYQIPEKRTQPYPLVIVPGAAQTATNFNGTADGREGWTQYFLRRGYAVYMVEQPGRARSSTSPTPKDRRPTRSFSTCSSVSRRRRNIICGRRRAYIRNGSAPVWQGMRTSISSLPRRCRSCKSRRSHRRSTATLWWR